MENDELNAEDIQDDVFSADIDDEDYLDDFAEEKKDEEEETDEEEPADDKPEEKDQTIAELKAELENQQKEINRLGYALRKNKPDDKKEDKETPFTEADLNKLYKEHYDDPDVVWQIMKEMTKLGKVDAQAAAEKTAEIKGKQAQIDHVINALYPDAKKEDSELYGGIQEAIEWAHLEGHPFADTLGLALLFLKDMPETIKHIKEETKKELEQTSKKQLEDKAEAARKGAINKNRPSKTGSSSSDNKSVSLTPSQLDTAKRMGFKTKEQLARYAKIVSKKGETVHAEG